MLTIIFAALVVWGILYTLDRKFDRGLDGFVCAGFVVIPALLNWLVGLALLGMGSPSWTHLIGMSLYVLVPFLMLKLQFDVPAKRATSYSGIALLTVIFTEARRLG